MTAADLEAATEFAKAVLESGWSADISPVNLARAFLELKGALEQEHAHYDALLQHNQEVAADLARERAAREEAEQKLDSWINRQFAWEGKPPAVFIRELKRRAEQAEARLATVEAVIKSALFQQFIKQGFWHAHHVDLVWRMDGKDITEQADWLKDLWYAIRQNAAGQENG